MENTKAAEAEKEDSISSCDDDDSKVKLKRQVGLLGGMSLIVGTIIGSGIFISPSGVFSNAGSVGLGLIIWLACGIFGTLGALCYAELGTMIPKSGGEYSILLEAFGPIPAYLFAWTATVITNPSSFALLSITFARYALAPAYGNCDDVPELGMKLVAAVLILCVVLINCVSVKLTTNIVTVFGVGKVLSLVIIIICGIVRLCQGHTENFENAFVTPNPPGLREITLAFYQGLWAVDGWNQLNYIIEELKDPFRTLPRAMMASMAIVTVLYVFTNVAYLSAMSFETLLLSPAVAASFAGVVLGPVASAIPIAVACSVVGTCFGSCFTAGRISYAAAREGHFNLVLSMIHIKLLTPAPAVILNGIIALLMVIPNNFDSLIQYYSFVKWFFHLVTCLALLWFRYKLPDAPRPVKVNIVIPILFALFCVCLVLFPIIDNPQIQYLVAIFTILFGLVFYVPFVHFKMKSQTIRNFNMFMQKLLMVSFPEDTSS